MKNPSTIQQEWELEYYYYLNNNNDGISRD